LIAMIQGFCVGGGVRVALAADLRIASDDARFGIPAAKLGLGYGYDGLKVLSDLVGPAYAREILFTGRLFSAEQALHMGLVNQIVPVADLEGVVRRTAQDIAANAPLTVRTAKAALNEAVKDPAMRDLDRVAAMVEQCFDSKDYKEGREAFMAKRKPIFTGT
ncbi:MAG: enoyl-CoA hydratase-related protein, partial [Kiloniellales bacterium]